jgi:hypothetical protein
VANNEYIERLQRVIRHLHKCDAAHLETVPVKETFRGETVWEGDVEVFSVTGHPRAKKCYAWGAKIGEPGESYKAVLEIRPVNDAASAVRISILADHKKEADTD